MENGSNDKSTRKSYLILLGVSLNILALIWLVLLFKQSTTLAPKMLWSALGLLPFWYTFYLVQNLITLNSNKEPLEV